MLGKFRKLQSNPADVKAVTDSYNNHIRDVFRDRSIITSMENLAEQAARLEDVELPHLVLTIDAMDKSKWLVPRCLDSTKRLGQLWRPALHFVGVLVAGVLEFYAVLEADVHGDSDTQQTLLSRALELAEIELRKLGKKMPWRIVIHCDNTPKEGRNSFMVQWCAAMVVAQRFADVSLAWFRVGHTHNRLDQRFSVIGSLLTRAEALETPSDYVSHLQRHYRSARGVPAFFEQVGDCHHWRTFFAPLEKHYAGVTGTVTTADAAHVIRVVRRDLVRLCVPEVDFPEHQDGSPEDAILLAKHWLHSKRLSQPPTLLLSGPLSLNFNALERAPRLTLNADSVKQYRKTAEVILQPPWHLESAAAYILQWLQANQAQTPHAHLPVMTFVVEGRDFVPDSALTSGSTWKDFAPEGAIPIVAVRKPQQQQKRARSSNSDVPQLAVISRRARAVMNAQQEQGQQNMDEDIEADQGPALRRPASSKGRGRGPKKRPARRG